MKSSLGLLCLATALLYSGVASAQLSQSFGDSGGQAGYQSSVYQPEVSSELYEAMPYTENPYGGGLLGQGGPQRIRGPIGGGLGHGGLGQGRLGPGGLLGGVGQNRNATAAGRPGRFWTSINVADRGLGYEGSYASLGGKNRLFEDRFGGRWLVEGNAHHSLIDNGGFFSNIGLERVFSIDAANADVTASVWYDYDGDTQANFSHNFHQIGASLGLKTPKWDLLGNGYFPVGTTDYTYGDLSGVNCFVENRIVMIPGIDSALEGFDVTLRIRPDRARMYNGTIDLGAYSYKSDIINAFGGGRLRAGFQVLGGMLVSAEVNHDERFDTTGVLTVGWLFGAHASGSGHEYTTGGRDLEQTVRNDHIVRFNQDVVLAIDPDTGLAYNVVHVDNTAAGTETGFAENPFSSLAAAEAASVDGDIIFVRAGDGTDFNMDQGIVLKDNQFLLGSGVETYIPVQNGQFFRLCIVPDGNRPTISNVGGTEVIQLANNNVVGGINVDATGATFGISGNGVNDGLIRDSIISGATQDGVLLAGVTGSWDILRNSVTGSGRDGIRFENFDTESIDLVDNITSNNIRTGLFLENYANFAGTGFVNVVNHTSVGNFENGMHFLNGSGNLNVLDSTVTNNFAAGAKVENWATAPDQLVTFGTSADGQSNFEDNGAFANIDFLINDPGVITNALVTNQTISGGVNGVSARVGGIDGGGQASTLNIDIVDNLAISNHFNTGILLGVDEGGIINANINSSDPTAPQQITGNGIANGAGIVIAADGPTGQDASEVNAVIRNVAINNSLAGATAGIYALGLNNSKIDLEVTDSTIGNVNSPVFGINIELDNVFNPPAAPMINRIAIENVTVAADVGVRLVTGTETSTDLSIVGSTITPGGDDNGSGLIVDATGAANLTGNFFMPNYPTDNFAGVPVAELATDGIVDNLTRVTLRNNTIQGFNGDGASISTRGDAHLLLAMSGNQVIGNGAGDGSVPFFDGVNIDAFDDSVLTTVVSNNRFQGNFERGLSLNTYHRATINASLVGNVFIGNDVGEDPGNTIPPIGTGTEAGPTGPVVDAGIFDFEAINNEEFYFRPYESLILLNPAGNPSDLALTDLPADTLGFFFAANGSPTDIFAIPVIGSFATLNLDMSENTFSLGRDMQDFSLAPGDFVLGLNGASNGFVGPVFGLTPSAYGFTTPIIAGIEGIFAGAGF